MTEMDRAYIAGLFDGEGCVAICYRKASKNKKRYARLLARIANTNKNVLYWVRDTLGFGSVHVCHRKGNRLDIYNYIVAYEAARRFLWVVEPYVRIKEKAVKEALERDMTEVNRRDNISREEVLTMMATL